MLESFFMNLNIVFDFKFSFFNTLESSVFYFSNHLITSLEFFHGVTDDLQLWFWECGLNLGFFDFPSGKFFTIFTFLLMCNMFFISGVEFFMTFFLVEWSSSSSSSNLFVECMGNYSWLSNELLVLFLLDCISFSVESWAAIIGLLKLPFAPPLMLSPPSRSLHLHLFHLSLYGLFLHHHPVIELDLVLFRQYWHRNHILPT